MKTKILTTSLILSIMLIVPMFKTIAHAEKYSSKLVIQMFENVAGLKTDTFSVRGNCGMCKSTIEGSLKKVKGISSATWNQTTKKITVTYDSAIISLKQIHQKIADAGYDTDLVKAKDAVYNKLPKCCHYDRN